MNAVDELILTAGLLIVVGALFSVVAPMAQVERDEGRVLYNIVVRIHISLEAMYNDNNTLRVIPVEIPLDHRVLLVYNGSRGTTSIVVRGPAVDELLYRDIRVIVEKSDYEGIVDNVTYSGGSIEITYRGIVLTSNVTLTPHIIGLKFMAHVSGGVTVLDVEVEIYRGV